MNVRHMKEQIELRVNFDFADILFDESEGRNVGTSVRVVRISTSDPRFQLIPDITKDIRERFGRGFFFAWSIHRTYTKQELNDARLFLIKIKSYFEPTGEELGTEFDLSQECEICGSCRKQVGPLFLKRGSIPRKDICRTIGGEIVVSERFAEWAKENDFKGAEFGPIFFSKESRTNLQLIPKENVDLSPQTIAGVDPFDFSESSEAFRAAISGRYEVSFDKEIYRCPKGHTLGLNLISEAFVRSTQSLNDFDVLASSQFFGVKRGLLRPQPLYFCSPEFMKKFKESRLTGADFEIARVVPAN